MEAVQENLAWLERALVAVDALLSSPFVTPGTREVLYRLKSGLLADRRCLLLGDSQPKDMAAD